MQTLADIIKDERSTHREAALLAKLADREAFTPEYVATRADLLEPLGLDPEDMTPQIVLHARRILAGHMRQVEAWVDEWNEKHNPKPQFAPQRANALPMPKGVPAGDSATATAVAPVPGGRQKLFGYPITAVLRWMGQDDWTFEPTRQALRKLGVVLSDSTIHIQLLGGKKGQRGAPAELTAKQANQLYDALDDE